MVRPEAHSGNYVAGTSWFQCKWPSGEASLSRKWEIVVTDFCRSLKDERKLLHCAQVGARQSERSD